MPATPGREKSEAVKSTRSCTAGQHDMKLKKGF